MANLLISEPPLQVLPTLAVKLKSVDKAIILQQFHYWLLRSNNIRDGYVWIYNSIKDWHEQFPWLAEKTVQRYIKDLVDRGLLVTANYNQYAFDRTKWYRIDYEALAKLGERGGPAVPTKGIGSTSPKGTDSTQGRGPAGVTNTNRLPETNQKITTRYKNKSSARGSIGDDGGSEDKKEVRSTADAEQFPWQAIVDYLNQKTGKSFRHVDSTKRLILARHKEGFSVDDMKRAIDNQCREWLRQPKMVKYLRPQTIFRESKFEGYLNNEPEQQSRRGGWFA